MNKSVWIINQHTATPNTTSGHYRHYYLASKYVKKGYNVVIVKGSYSHLSKDIKATREKYSLTEYDNQKLKIISVKTPKYDSNRFLGRIYNMLVFFWRTLWLRTPNLPKPDIVLVSSMPLFSIINGLYIKWKFQAKFILEIRDIWPLTAIQLGGFSKYHPFILLLAWIERLGYKKADLIVSVLPSFDKYLQHTLPQLKHKFVWISNGYLTNDNNYQYNEKVPINKNKFIVGYTGTIGKANGMAFFIEAAKLLRANKKIHFVLVGDGYLKPQLIEKVKAYKLTNVSFIDKVPKEKVLSYLKKFNVCYLGFTDKPIYQYGVSANKIYDYMHAKKPILMSGNIEKNPIEISNCGITVPPDNPQAVADGILHFYEMDEASRTKLGENGYKHLIRNYTYEVLSKKYIRCFKNLLS